MQERGHQQPTVQEAPSCQGPLNVPLSAKHSNVGALLECGQACLSTAFTCPRRAPLFPRAHGTYLAKPCLWPQQKEMQSLGLGHRTVVDWPLGASSEQCNSGGWWPESLVTGRAPAPALAVTATPLACERLTQPLLDLGDPMMAIPLASCLWMTSQSDACFPSSYSRLDNSSRLLAYESS